MQHVVIFGAIHQVDDPILQSGLQRSMNRQNDGHCNLKAHEQCKERCVSLQSELYLQNPDVFAPECVCGFIFHSLAIGFV